MESNSSNTSTPRRLRESPDGISSQRLDKHLRLLEKSLEIKRFSFTQYLDIFRGFSEGVKDIISVYYVNAHKNNLGNLIRQMGAGKILPKYLPADGEEVSPSEFIHFQEVFQEPVEQLIREARERGARVEVVAAPPVPVVR